MHKYIRKYQDKNGKWVYVYHEHGVSPKHMTIGEYHEKIAQDPQMPVVEHLEHEKDLPVERVLMQRNLEQNPSMPHSDYLNARKSAVPNVGEDIVGSARHQAAARSIGEMKKDPGKVPLSIPPKSIREANPIDFFTPLDHKSLNPFDVLYAHECFNKIPGYKMLDPKTIKTEEDAEKIQKEHYESYIDMVDMAIKYLNDFVSKKSGSEPLFYKASSDFMKALNAYVKDRKLEGKEFDYETYKTLYNNFGIVKRSGVVNSLNDLASALSVYYRTNNANSIISKSYGDDRIYKVLEHVFNGKKIDTAVDIAVNNVIVEEPATRSKPKEKKKTTEKVLSKYVRQGPQHKDLPSEEDIEGNIKFASEKIGFRGIQWGNAVTDAERKFHLNAINTAMQDLCETLGLPLSMGSYNGKIGIAVGARGKGVANAHYEPSKAVINLTRTAGAGSLAHEWFHAIDNFIFRIVSNNSMGEYGYISKFNETKSDNKEYSEVIDAIRDLVRSDAFDVYRKDVANYLVEQGFARSRLNYFTSLEESVTRAFESYLNKKMQDKGIKNNYLVGDTKLTGGIYPSEQVLEKLEPLFDRFFEKIKNTDLLKKFESWWG